MVKAEWQPSYPTWFAKDVWFISEAEYLIWGLEPALIGKAEFRQAMEPGAPLYWFDDATRILRRQLLRQVWRSLDVSLDKGCPPDRIAQWVEDSGYQCDQAFYSFITDTANNIDYRDNSWIDLGYDDWAKKEAWTLDEAADLLAGFPVGKDLEKQNCDNDRHSKVYDALTRAVAIGKVRNLAIKEGDYLFEPKSLMAWAKKKGIVHHPQLLRSFGLLNAVVERNGHPIDLIKCGTSLNDALRAVYYQLSAGYTSKVKNADVIPQLRKDMSQYPSIKSVTIHEVKWETVEGKEISTNRATIVKTLSNFRKQLKSHGLEA